MSVSTNGEQQSDPASVAERPTCGTCPYWEGPMFSTGRGTCHRPMPDYEGDWPPTYSQGWCGEHPDFPAWLAAQRAASVPAEAAIETTTEPAGRVVIADVRTTLALAKDVATAWINGLVIAKSPEATIILDRLLDATANLRGESDGPPSTPDPDNWLKWAAEKEGTGTTVTGAVVSTPTSNALPAGSLVIDRQELQDLFVAAASPFTQAADRQGLSWDVVEWTTNQVLSALEALKRKVIEAAQQRPHADTDLASLVHAAVDVMHAYARPSFPYDERFTKLADVLRSLGANVPITN